MDGAVVFADYVDHSKTPYVYAAADVTVAASIWDEPFGKVVTESMATGVPVIGSRRGAIPEIIDDGIDGLLVENPKDAKSVSDHIVALLEDSERRREMGDLARRKVVERFAKPIRLARTRAFYRSLAAEDKMGHTHGADEVVI